MTDVAQESFGSGELSPRIRGQRSSDQFRTGLRQCQNFLIKGFGSLQRRGGTEYISAVYDSTENVRLIPFSIPGVGDYVLEFQDEICRFYKNGAILGAPYTLVTEFDHTDIQKIQFSTDGKDLYLVHQDYWPRKVSRTSDTSWTIAELSFGKDFPSLEIRAQPYTLAVSATTAGGAVVLTASDDVFKQSDANSGKLVFLQGGWGKITAWRGKGTEIGFTNLQVPPSSTDPTANWLGIYEEGSLQTPDITVTFLDAAGAAGDEVQLDASASAFTADDVGKVIDVDAGGTARTRYCQITSYSSATRVNAVVLYTSVTEVTYTDHKMLEPTNPLGGTTLTPSDVTGSITLTASASHFESGHEPTSTEPGARFRLNGGYCTITSVTNGKTASATVNSDFTNTAATATWEESWSIAAGFPRAITFHQGRLYLAGASGAHNVLWASRPNKPENFKISEGESLDSDSLNFPLNQIGEVIEWLTSAESILIGARDAEVIGDGLITPGEFDFKRQSTYGGSNIQPQTIDNASMFVGRDGLSVRAMSYNFEDDRYRAQALSDLADHLLSSAIVELHYARTPAPALLCLLSDGTLLQLFYNPQSGVVGWGTWLPAGTDAAVKSLCVVPGTARDDIYLAVSRTINSATAVYVERYEPDSRTDSFLDEDTLTITATSISGLSHLEGESVYAKLDGVYRGAFTVASGAIDISSLNLDDAPTTAEVGLGYTSSAKVYPQSFNDNNGVRHSKITSIKGLDLYLVESTGGNVNGNNIKYRTTDDQVGSAASAFTGWKRFDGVNQTDRNDDPVIAITEDRPLSLEIAGLVMSVS